MLRFHFSVSCKFWLHGFGCSFLCSVVLRLAFECDRSLARFDFPTPLQPFLLVDSFVTSSIHFFTCLSVCLASLLGQGETFPVLETDRSPHEMKSTLIRRWECTKTSPGDLGNRNVVVREAISIGTLAFWRAVGSIQLQQKATNFQDRSHFALQTPANTPKKRCSAAPKWRPILESHHRKEAKRRRWLPPMATVPGLRGSAAPDARWTPRSPSSPRARTPVASVGGTAPETELYGGVQTAQRCAEGGRARWAATADRVMDRFG